MCKKLIYFVSVFMVLGLIGPAAAQDMEIGFATLPPVIDGEVDDVWADAAAADFVPLEDPADGSGIWKVLYDAENLYVLVDMTDESLLNDSASSWQDDSVEIYFDGGNTKLSTPLSGDDHQYTFGWTTDDIQGTNVTGYTEGIEHGQATTDTGWRIEVKMPWMSIWGVVPQAGDLIGIDCYYNDDDDGGDSREGKMLSFSTVEGWNDASQWGTAVLAAEPPAGPAAVTTGHVYLLDNVTGTEVPDDSANDNTGTIVGDPQVVDGLSGKALQFDGVDDGVDIPDSEFINVTAGPWPNRTVIAVFNCADVTKQEKQTVFEEGGLTRGLTIYVVDSQVYVGGWNKAEYQWNPGSWLSAPINSNQWYTVSLVIRDGAEAQEDDKFEMWMDGNFIGSALGGRIHNHSNDNAIGYTKQNNVFHDGDGSGDGWYFEGMIDEVWILNEAVGKVPVALGPTPSDGALHDDTSVNLSWKPGGYAVTQDVYFGDNLDDVTAGAEGTFLASLSPAAVGVAVGNLLPETTYYWRVDAVNDVNPESPWTGQVWSFTLPTQTAYDPSPADGALFVNPDVTLSWAPGVGAESHIVYIGDNFDDVNNAADGIAQSEPNFTPEAPLAKGTVYYWRVDEFDGTDTHKGDVWSLETPPDIAITDPNLVAWWKLDGEFFDLGYVVDYSGYDHHGMLRGDPQLVEGYDGGAIELDGSGDYVTIPGWKAINADRTDPDNPFNPAFSIACWIKTTGNGSLVCWGSSDGTGVGGQYQNFRVNEGRLRAEHGNGNLQSDTSVNDGEWHHIAQVSVEGANLRVPNTILYIDGMEDAIRGGSDNIYNLTEDADVNIGRRASHGDRLFTGLFDDVRVYDKALTELEVKIISGFVMSTNPDPADGAKLVDNLVILAWSPGPFAAEFDVYLGTNPEPGTDELVGRVSEPTHFATDLVEGQTYYWRIDDVEADGTTIHTSDVWSFWIPPKGAYQPVPADGEAVTDIETDLSWTADWNPVMYVVHFGTDADQVTNTPAGFGPPLMETGFDPGPLEPGTTYYWRADVFYGTWVTGPVWSFTVSAP